MATYVRIKGFDRGDSVVASGTVLSAGSRGFRAKTIWKYSLTGVKATKAGGATTSTLTVTAKYGGTWANGHTVNVSQAGSNVNGVVTVAFAAGTGVPTWTVTGTAATTANQAAAALNADPGFAQLYTAVGGGTGTTLVSPGALATGTDVSTLQNIYVQVNNKSNALVDVDDPETTRTLRRNTNRFISLGAV